MKNKELLAISTHFERYIKEIYGNSELPEIQHTEIKKAFYGGFASLLFYLKFSNISDFQEKLIEEVDDYYEELVSFIEIEVLTDRKTPK